MFKRIITSALTVIMCAVLTVPAFAHSYDYRIRLFDRAVEKANSISDEDAESAMITVLVNTSMSHDILLSTNDVSTVINADYFPELDIDRILYRTFCPMPENLRQFWLEDEDFHIGVDIFLKEKTKSAVCDALEALSPRVYTGEIFITNVYVESDGYGAELWGSLTDDNPYELFDAVLILQYCAGWYEKIDYYKYDVNNDGIVDVIDVIYVMRRVAGWEGWSHVTVDPEYHPNV